MPHKLIKNEWNELEVTDEPQGTRLIVSRAVHIGTGNLDDRLVAFEIHDDDKVLECYMTFEDAFAIREHIAVIFKEHDENGDFG